MAVTKNSQQPNNDNDINHKNSVELECKMSIEDQELSHILFLPMDNIDYEKYYDFILNKKPSGRKTIQTRIYMFLEHPSGWLGLLYHVSV